MWSPKTNFALSVWWGGGCTEKQRRLITNYYWRVRLLAWQCSAAYHAKRKNMLINSSNQIEPRLCLQKKSKTYFLQHKYLVKTFCPRNISLVLKYCSYRKLLLFQRFLNLHWHQFTNWVEKKLENIKQNICTYLKYHKSKNKKGYRIVVSRSTSD